MGYHGREDKSRQVAIKPLREEGGVMHTSRRSGPMHPHGLPHAFGKRFVVRMRVLIRVLFVTCVIAVRSASPQERPGLALLAWVCLCHVVVYSAVCPNACSK